MPRSKERSLQQLPARLARLEKNNVTFWICSDQSLPGVCYEVAATEVEVAELVAVAHKVAQAGVRHSGTLGD